MEKRPFSDISYEQFLKDEKIMGSQCIKCGAIFVPPRQICVKCHSSEMEWFEFTGRGNLAAFTCVSVVPPFMASEGYDRKNPYCSGVVELKEGGRVDARIEGVDASKPEDIRIGMELEAKFLHKGEGEASETYLAFQPLQPL